MSRLGLRGAGRRSPKGKTPAAIAAGGRLTNAGGACWAAVPHGGIPPTEVPSDGPVALILGNEPHGLDAGVVEACTGWSAWAASPGCLLK